MTRLIDKTPVCVFAKPPRPGEVKTRLAASIGAVAAAEFATAFLRDTVELVGSCPWARVILATTGCDSADLANSEPALGWLAGSGVEVWDQGDGDLGARLDRVSQRALAESNTVLVIGADSPAMPSAYLDSARASLGDHDVILGPAKDGGFYMIAARKTAPGWLEGIAWSAPDTLAQTIGQNRSCGLDVGFAPEFFDVDNSDDLIDLRELLEQRPTVAQHTRAVLCKIDKGGS